MRTCKRSSQRGASRQRGKRGKREASDDIEDASALAEILGEEVPLVGTVMRGYRHLKRHLTREYRERIDELEALQKRLIETVSQLTDATEELRLLVKRREAEIAELSVRIKELEGEDAD